MAQLISPATPSSPSGNTRTEARLRREVGRPVALVDDVSAERAAAELTRD